MVLDMESFRSDKGGDPNKVRTNQEKRFKDLNLVETVIAKGETVETFAIFACTVIIFFQTPNGERCVSKPISTTS